MLLSLFLLLPKPTTIWASTFNERAGTKERHLPNSFAVQLTGQSETSAREIAARYGFKVITKVSTMQCKLTCCSNTQLLAIDLSSVFIM